MLQPGTIILGKYRIERVLGKGGMGIVVAVRHVQLGELFALKTLLPQALEHVDAMQRFLREAQACARLKGEHVTRVHDVGSLEDGTPYMLMEYLEGEDLGRVLDRRGALPVEEVALYVYQACEAVGEAHALGIVHRDLKPSNLFLTRRPSGAPCTKVLDFGISKIIGQADQANMKLTKTGDFLGSPMYMSPEQMTDVRTTDVRADIWSLGVILYELLTARSPFEADAVPTVVTRVLLSHPPPPSTLQSAIPPELDAIVMRCIDKLAERRFQTVRELMDALEPFIGVPSSRIILGLDRMGSGPQSARRPPIQVAETMPGGSIDPREAMAATMPGPTSSAALIEARQVEQTLQAMPSSVPLPEPSQSIASVNTDSMFGSTTKPSASESTSMTEAPSAPAKRTFIFVAIAAAILIALGVGTFVATKASTAGLEADSATMDASAAQAASSPSTAFVTAMGSISTTTLAQTTSVATSDKRDATARQSPALTTTTKSTSPTGTAPRVTKKKTVVRGYDD